MKVKITRKFVADDGMEFNSAKDCELYENIYTRARYASEHALNKSDFDFLKDFMSRVISSNEYFLNVLKEEAKRSKEDNPEHSKLCYKDWTKARNEINKLAAIQKKIKSLR